MALVATVQPTIEDFVQKHTEQWIDLFMGHPVLKNMPDEVLPVAANLAESHIWPETLPFMDKPMEIIEKLLQPLIAGSGPVIWDYFCYVFNLVKGGTDPPSFAVLFASFTKS